MNNFFAAAFAAPTQPAPAPKAAFVLTDPLTRLPAHKWAQLGGPRESKFKIERMLDKMRKHPGSDAPRARQGTGDKDLDNAKSPRSPSADPAHDPNATPLLVPGTVGQPSSPVWDPNPDAGPSIPDLQMPLMPRDNNVSEAVLLPPPAKPVAPSLPLWEPAAVENEFMLGHGEMIEGLATGGKDYQYITIHHDGIQAQLFKDDEFVDVVSPDVPDDMQFVLLNSESNTEMQILYNLFTFEKFILPFREHKSDFKWLDLMCF